MRRLALLSATLLAVLLLASPASAAPPRHYSGELQVLPGFGFADVRNTGTVNHFRFTSTTLLTGSLVGRTTVDMSCIGYEEQYERSFTCHGTLRNAGTVAATGEAFSSTSHGHFRCSFVTGRCRGTSVTDEASGAFAGTHGVAKTEQDAFTGAGTYTLSVTGRR
jgi:hypothetical protein